LARQAENIQTFAAVTKDDEVSHERAYYEPGDEEVDNHSFHPLKPHFDDIKRADLTQTIQNNRTPFLNGS
jgi:hypothetical protein